MRDELKKLLNNSYSPYSKFRVAAICEMMDGKTFGGVNVENASYGATICAERVAVDTAIANGYTKGDFSKLYLMCDSDTISTCCFLCRQVISEFYDASSEVICYNNVGETRHYFVKDFCPYPFGKEDLK